MLFKFANEEIEKLIKPKEEPVTAKEVEDFYYRNLVRINEILRIHGKSIIDIESVTFTTSYKSDAPIQVGVAGDGDEPEFGKDARVKIKVTIDAIPNVLPRFTFSGKGFVLRVYPHGTMIYEGDKDESSDGGVCQLCNGDYIGVDRAGFKTFVCYACIDYAQGRIQEAAEIVLEGVKYLIIQERSTAWKMRKPREENETEGNDIDA